ncbi:transposase [Spirillospora sp. NPDC052269]
MGVCVSPANVSDRDGALVLLTRARPDLPRLGRIWADQGYCGQVSRRRRAARPFAARSAAVGSV